MGNLTVANRTQGGTFNVYVSGNLTIKNYKGDRPLQTHEAKTVIKNGNPTNYYQWSNPKKPTKERALQLNSTNYTIFDAVRKSDKKDNKGEKLTQSDLDAFRNNKKLQKELGVTVKYDPQEKVYGIYGQYGTTLYFDFE